MAIMERSKSPLVLLCLIAVLPYYGSTFSIPSIGTVIQWAKYMDNKLTDKALALSTHAVVTQAYKNLSDVTFEKVNATNLVEKMAEEMGVMLKGKMEALKRSVQKAEEAAVNHRYNAELQYVRGEYLNAKDTFELEDKLEYSERFKQEVNTSVSTVHIPLEIYEGDIEILNGLKWSAALDSVFRDNYLQDDQMLWQYFGSQTGFMRTFPGSKWRVPDNEKVDLYDVRRRPWYTQGSSSPKDMLILIDNSGSVHGKTLQLMKVAVKSILDTLGENDFVHVLNFSADVKKVSCFDTFVQANYRNKKNLSEAVDQIEANGMADFEKALTRAFEAFEEFENSSRQWEGARCNRMIMLLTDGGTDNAEKVFREKNWSRKKKIRVFTYAVGQTANPVKDIKWMSCVNAGKFSEIPAMGAIRSKVQEYVSIVASPMARHGDQTFKWTSSFADLARHPEYVPVLSRIQAIKDIKNFKWGNIYQDHLGLGMMTTVTLPVYDQKPASSNRTILGVMGIDVTTKQMEAFTPTWKLGPLGYAFAINPNGYVIFHPNLKIRTYMKDPPNMDILDLEVNSDEILEVRQEMIDGIKNTKSLKNYVTSPDERHVDREDRVYSYTKILNTSFSLGICIPKNLHVARINNNDDFLEQYNSTMYNVESFIAPWDYFEEMSKTINYTGKLTDFIAEVKRVKNSGQKLKWNTDMVRQFNLDFKNLMNFLIQKKDFTQLGYDLNQNITDNVTEDCVATFVGSVGGLTHIYPAKEADLLKDQRDPWKANYFRRALDADNQVIFSAKYTLKPRNVNDTVPPIMATKAVSLNPENAGNAAYKPAVVGAFMKVNIFSEILANATINDSIKCDDSSDLLCYLLDDGAFLVATNHRESMNQIGRFFGHIDKGLMTALYNKTYLRLESYDYQAVCLMDNSGIVSAAPGNFRIPSIHLLINFFTINWWTHLWNWAINFNIYNLLFAKDVEAETMIDEDHYACIKKQAQYFFKSGFNYTSDVFYPCKNNCTRDFAAARFEKSNLLLVVVSPPCQDCEEEVDQRLLQEPVEDPGPDLCTTEPRYRRNAEPCFDYETEDTKCSGPLSHPLSTLMITMATIITTLSTFFLTQFPR